MKFGIITDAKGSVDQVEVDLTLNSTAQAAGAKHLLAHLDNTVPVAAGMPTPRQQIYAQAGLSRRDITLKDALDGRSLVQAGLTGPTTQDGSVTGRLVTLPFLYDAIENALRNDTSGMLATFNSRAASVDSIPGTKFDRPIINMSRPAGARSQGVSQLAEPTRMLTLTTSSNSYSVPGVALGLEYSDQAAAAVTLPIVTMSMTRQAEEEAAERVDNYWLSFLNGDTDFGMPSLASLGIVKNAKANFDSSISTAGTLTQKAWVSWLYENSRARRIDTVICDLPTALAIENRTGRPTVNTDNATSPRIDIGMSVLNPTWPNAVQIIIATNPAWPANTMVAFDSRYGYHVVNSTSMSYEGVEQMAIRRSTKIRIDSGSVSYRLFNDAWTALTLTV
mgnify:CR=1 FL=1